MIEIEDGVCQSSLICDSCIHRRRFMISDIGRIYGVFCLSRNDIVSPVPVICSEYSKNYHEMPKGQHTLKLEY